jgi:hypothetical protein
MMSCCTALCHAVLYRTVQCLYYVIPYCTAAQCKHCAVLHSAPMQAHCKKAPEQRQGWAFRSGGYEVGAEKGAKIRLCLGPERDGINSQLAV